eukprot:g13965.t1
MLKTRTFTFTNQPGVSAFLLKSVKTERYDNAAAACVVQKPWMSCAVKDAVQVKKKTMEILNSSRILIKWKEQ